MELNTNPRILDYSLTNLNHFSVALSPGFNIGFPLLVKCSAFVSDPINLLHFDPYVFSLTGHRFCLGNILGL